MKYYYQKFALYKIIFFLSKNITHAYFSFRIFLKRFVLICIEMKWNSLRMYKVCSSKSLLPVRTVERLEILFPGTLCEIVMLTRSHPRAP